MFVWGSCRGFELLFATGPSGPRTFNRWGRDPGATLRLNFDARPGFLLTSATFASFSRSTKNQPLLFGGEPQNGQKWRKFRPKMTDLGKSLLFGRGPKFEGKCFIF